MCWGKSVKLHKLVSGILAMTLCCEGESKDSNPSWKLDWDSICDHIAMSLEIPDEVELM